MKGKEKVSSRPSAAEYERMVLLFQRLLFGAIPARVTTTPKGRSK